MAIPKWAKANLATLIRAAKADDLALMECTEAGSGKTRYVLCAAGREPGKDGGEDMITMTPFGHLCDEDNPFEFYKSPIGEEGDRDETKRD